MLIDELIELSKQVMSKEAFLKYQRKIEDLDQEEKTEVLKLLKKHNFNKDYLVLLFGDENSVGIGYDEMSLNLAFINAIVDDDNVTPIRNSLKYCENLYYIDDMNWMIEIFKYVKDSNYDGGLLDLINEHFEIRDHENRYKEAVIVLNTIKKLNYSQTIINYFARLYEEVDFGGDNIDEDIASALIDTFDTELLEKENITFYEDPDFAKLNTSTQIELFRSMKNLSDEQKENDTFLDCLDTLLVDSNLIDNFDEEEVISLINHYISLYDSMEEKDSFQIILNYLLDNIICVNISVDNMNKLMDLYNQNLENLHARKFLKYKGIIQNSDAKDIESIIHTIESLDEDSLSVQKSNIYNVLEKGCKTPITELLSLITDYNYDSEILTFICQTGFATIDGLKDIINKKITTTLESEMENCSDINALTEYFTFLKNNMEDSETLDLTPKTMIKKREYYNASKKNSATAPVDKTEN